MKWLETVEFEQKRTLPKKLIDIDNFHMILKEGVTGFHGERYEAHFLVGLGNSCFSWPVFGIQKITGMFRNSLAFAVERY